jgi:hypothetical protein
MCRRKLGLISVIFIFDMLLCPFMLARNVHKLVHYFSGAKTFLLLSRGMPPGQ